MQIDSIKQSFKLLPMDFFHNILKQEMDKTYTCSYDEFEDEDDVFYDELRRQVLKLTADEDDDYLCENKWNSKMVEARKQDPKNGSSHVAQHRCYYNWTGNKDDCVAPDWILNLWRTGNGTGFFIPQIVFQSRRKNRPRRKKNERGRTYKQVEKII